MLELFTDPERIFIEVREGTVDGTLMDPPSTVYLDGDFAPSVFVCYCHQTEVFLRILHTLSLLTRFNNYCRISFLTLVAIYSHLRAVETMWVSHKVIRP